MMNEYLWWFAAPFIVVAFGMAGNWLRRRYGLMHLPYDERVKELKK